MSIRVLFRVLCIYKFSFGFHVNTCFISGSISIQVSFQVPYQYGFYFGFYFVFYVDADFLSGSMLMRILFRIPFWCCLISGSMSTRVLFRVLFRYDFLVRSHFDAVFISDSILMGISSRVLFWYGLYHQCGFYSSSCTNDFLFGSYTTTILFWFVHQCYFISVLTPIAIEFLISPTQSRLHIGLETCITFSRRQNFGSSRI